MGGILDSGDISKSPDPRARDGEVDRPPVEPVWFVWLEGAKLELLSMSGYLPRLQGSVRLTRLGVN